MSERYSFTTVEGHVFSGVAGMMHSFDDAPAVTYADGTRWWYRGNQVHRDGAPAIVWGNGVEEWFQENQRHREDGPAVTYPDAEGVSPMVRGVRQWWVRGVMQREEVPAAAQAAREAWARGVR
jgi:hypothetical protein